MMCSVGFFMYAVRHRSVFPAVTADERWLIMRSKDAKSALQSLVSQSHSSHSGFSSSSFRSIAFFLYLSRPDLPTHARNSPEP